VPKRISRDEKVLLDKLGESPNFIPQPDANDRKSFFDQFKGMFDKDKD
jgi:hypothetical protein